MVQGKAVLLSVRPNWCKLIWAGMKTVEVRKTCPKLETPFKVYIYCSGNSGWLMRLLLIFSLSNVVKIVVNTSMQLDAEPLISRYLWTHERTNSL